MLVFDEKKKQVDDDIANLKEDNRKMNEANKIELKQEMVKFMKDENAKFESFKNETNDVIGSKKQEIEGMIDDKEKKMNQRIQTTEQFLNDFKISLTDDFLIF